MRRLLMLCAVVCLFVAGIGLVPAGASHGANGTVCLVVDPGGFDNPYNGPALEGLERAERQLHVVGVATVPETEAEITEIIAGFVATGECDLIIGVGFLVGGPMEPFVAANPTQYFAVVDFQFFGEYPNATEILYRVDQSSFLAGYIAAATSTTGTVGVYGGAPIPPVTMFMDGYALGVDYYNAQYGAAVEVLGWDPVAQTGLLLDFEFTNPSLGYEVTAELLDLGADTVFAVAGFTGLGSLEAVSDRKLAGQDVRVMEPDFDWFEGFGDPARVLATSVLKKSDVAVFNIIAALVDGTLVAGEVWEDLESGGTDLSPFHRTNDQIRPAIRNDLKPIRSGIIDGLIPTMP